MIFSCEVGKLQSNLGKYAIWNIVCGVILSHNVYGASKKIISEEPQTSCNSLPENDALLVDKEQKKQFPFEWFVSSPELCI